MNLNIYLKTYHHTYSKKIYISRGKKYVSKFLSIKTKNNHGSYFLKKHKMIHYKKVPSLSEKKKIINTVKFCVFAGRKINIKILHHYIELLLKQDIIHEYHIFDMSHKISDCLFLKEEFIRLSSLFSKKNKKKNKEQRIFIHNHDQNYKKLQLIEKNKDNKKISSSAYSFSSTIPEKPDWSPFYKVISKKQFYDHSIIIKCDDDILFIDIANLQKAIYDRIQDTYSFLIHSNCINNNICAYYQKDLFPHLSPYLSTYPVGGILGPLFENPKIAYSMHDYFTNSYFQCKSKQEWLNYYTIPDVYVKSRLSINFILLRGEDCKYFKNIVHDDEYLVSSFFPEKLLRPNKIKGNFITSHYSYGLQTEIMNQSTYLYEKYIYLTKDYCSFIKDLSFPELPKIITEKQSLVKKYKSYLLYDRINGRTFLKAPHFNHSFLENGDRKFFYMKHCLTNQYLTIDYEENILHLSDNQKTLFQIEFISSQVIRIYLGIYSLTNFNIGDIKNKQYLLSLLPKQNEKNIFIENDPSDTCSSNPLHHIYLQFLNNQSYLSVKQYNPFTKTVLHIKKIKNSECLWNLEEYQPPSLIPHIYFERICKNQKFYYKDLENQQVYTNFYMGWGYEQILYT
jgi:hypothetical protein